MLLLQQQLGQVSAVAVLLPNPGLRRSVATIVRLSRAGAAAGGTELLLLLGGRRLLLGQQAAHMLHLRVGGEAETVQLRGLWAQSSTVEGSVAAVVEMKLLAAPGAAAPGPTPGPDIHDQSPQNINCHLRITCATWLAPTLGAAVGQEYILGRVQIARS